MKHVFCAVLAFVFSFVCRPAVAQDCCAAVDMTGMGILAMETAMMDAARETTPAPARSAIQRKTSPTYRRPAARARVTVTSEANLSFALSAAQTRVNIAKFVEKTRRTDPAGADRTAQLFANMDFMAQVATAIDPYGLRVNNIADDYTIYWINAWEASRGIVNSQETRSRVQAVKSQAARALLTAPEFATATNAQKQEFAEGLWIQAALISGHMKFVASDPRQLREAGVAVSTGARRFGLELSEMELTPTGFVPK
jgi:hypothetical protein